MQSRVMNASGPGSSVRPLFAFSFLSKRLTNLLLVNARGDQNLLEERRPDVHVQRLDACFHAAPAYYRLDLLNARAA